MNQTVLQVRPAICIFAVTFDDVALLQFVVDCNLFSLYMIFRYNPRRVNGFASELK